MKRIVFLLVCLLLVAACKEPSSSSSDSDSNAPVATVPSKYAGKANPYGTEAASGGAQLFHNNCETCHGPQGHGDGIASQSLEPKPKNLAVLQQSVDDDYLFWRISEGKPGSAMVAWKGIFTEEQIWQIVSFVRTLHE